MPKTMGKRKTYPTIGAAFSNRKEANKAVAAFKRGGVPEKDIEVSQTLSYNKKTQKALRKGNILVTVHHVKDPAAIIEIFDKYKAEYNPNGSRNVRQDVVGMTAGSAMGAAALGAVGAVLAGPVGAATGAAAGAILGAGTGAAAGKAMEDRK
jgi:hypothetical protein